MNYKDIRVDCVWTLISLHEVLFGSELIWQCSKIAYFSKPVI